MVQKISLLEIVSTCSAATGCGCGSSGVFCATDSVALQPVHRCTPASCGTLAAPAALPMQSTLVRRVEHQQIVSFATQTTGANDCE